MVRTNFWVGFSLAQDVWGLFIPCLTLSWRFQVGSLHSTQAILRHRGLPGTDSGLLLGIPQPHVRQKEYLHVYVCISDAQWYITVGLSCCVSQKKCPQEEMGRMRGSFFSHAVLLLPVSVIRQTLLAYLSGEGQDVGPLCLIYGSEGRMRVRAVVGVLGQRLRLHTR